MNTEKLPSIPTWIECSEAAEGGEDMTQLAQFIHEYEPSNNAQHFRELLAKVIQEAAMGDPSKPSVAMAAFLDFCPETKEPQRVTNIQGGKGLTLTTRGETTGWKHNIQTEEVAPDGED